MLQNYTNVKLQDDAAREETFVLDFRKRMVERQIGERKEEIIEEESDVSLKSNLEKFGMKKIGHLHKDILTKDQDRKVKEFNEKESTIIRKDDKRNVFVINVKHSKAQQVAITWFMPILVL